MDLEDQFAEFLNMMRDIVDEEDDLEEVAAQWWRSRIDVKATQKKRMGQVPPEVFV